MKKLLVGVILLISIQASAGWLDRYKLDPGLIMDEVYDVEYNIA